MKEWCIFLKNEGKQLNFVVFSGMVASALYFCADYLSKLMDNILLPIIKGMSLFLVFYYLAYSLILTKRIIEKYYKK